MKIQNAIQNDMAVKTAQACEKGKESDTASKKENIDEEVLTKEMTKGSNNYSAIIHESILYFRFTCCYRNNKRRASLCKTDLP